MLVANALLVLPHPLHRQHTVPRLQPPCIQLVVRYDEPEHHAQYRRQQSEHQKDDPPRLDGRSTLARPHRNAIRDEAPDDLAEAVEREPDTRPGALLPFGVPLGGEEGEAGGDGRLEDAEEEPDGDGAAEVGHRCEERQGQAPHEDAEGAVLCQGEALQEPVCWVSGGKED